MDMMTKSAVKHPFDEFLESLSFEDRKRLVDIFKMVAKRAKTGRGGK